MSFRRFFSALLCCCFAILTPFPHSTFVHASVPPPSLRIGEIAWAGSSLSTSDEWIELWNTSTQDISLSGYALIGASPSPILFSATATIPAQSTYLISNYGETDPKSILATPPQLVSSTIALSNTALLIKLLSPDGTEIDRAGDGNAPTAGMTGSIKASMIRVETTWITATSSLYLDSSQNDLGTPGICDGCLPAPVPAPSFAEEPVIPQIEAASSSPDISVEISPSPTSSSEMGASMEVVATETPPIITHEPSSSSTPVNEPSIENIEAILVTIPETTTTTITEEVGATTGEISLLESTSTADVGTETVSPTSTQDVHQNLMDTDATSTPLLSTNISPRTDPSVLRLNEIVAAPESGHEWIEVTSIDVTSPLRVTGLELHDSSGKILTLPDIALDHEHPFFVIELPSAKLNNDGDTVRLMNDVGIAVDSMTYTATKKGTSLSRIPDATGEWQETPDMTSGAANIFTPPPPPTPLSTLQPSSSSGGTVMPPIPISPSYAQVTTPTSTVPSNTTTTTSTRITKSTTNAKSSPKKTTTSVSTATKKPSTSARPDAAKATASVGGKAIKKIAPSKTVPKSKTSPSSMNSASSSTDIRVELHGIVGSPPGLLSSHAFILLSPDGRGLEVRIPTSQKLPLLGTSITVRGSLSFTNDNIPLLKVDTKSTWAQATTTLDEPRPRMIDFLAPSQEDAWSLGSVTGTVVGIRSGTIVLRLSESGEEILIGIRPVANYRTKRLALGDLITVTGVLDMGNEEPRLLPRQSEDILFVRHAETMSTKQMPPVLPGWMPFGAAGMAIVGTEGLKHVRERHKRRSLEKVLHQDHAGDV